LNFPLRSDGSLDEKELAVLDGISRWMAVNSEAIYDTKPWKVYGEGPSTQRPTSGRVNENARKELTSQDVRFTTRGATLYALVMGWPGERASISALSANAAGKIQNVELLGFKGRLKWAQDDNGLSVALPERSPSEYAITLKATLTA
jgi:alpha-L-fucosidase